MKSHIVRTYLFTRLLVPLLVIGLVLPPAQPIQAQTPDQAQGYSLFLPIAQGGQTLTSTEAADPMASDSEPTTPIEVIEPLIPTPSATASPTPSLLPTETPTATTTISTLTAIAVTPTLTATVATVVPFTVTPTATVVITATPTLTATLTPTATSQSTITATPTVTATPPVISSQPITPTQPATMTTTAILSGTLPEEKPANGDIQVNQLATVLPIVEHCGTVTSDQIWSANRLHLITCDVTINTSVTLTVRPGVIVKFSQGTSLYVYGLLSARANSPNRTIFTSIKDDAYGGDTNNDGSATTPAPGDWSSFLATDTGSINLQYATVQYGRITSYEGDVSITNSTIARSYHHGIDAQGGSLSLINNTITNHAKDGVYVNTTNLTTLVLTNNTFTGNGGGAAYLNLVQDHNGTLTINNNNGAGNVTNGIILFGTTGTLTLPPTPGLPYVVSNLTVPQNANLTLPAGVIMKLQGNGLSVEGALTVQGTASRRVIFTSIKDDAYGGDTNNDGSATTPAPGDWGNIRASRTGAITLHYATVQYGGSCCYNGIIESGGSISIANSIIAYGYGYGIYAQNSSLSLTNTTITNNAYDGIYASNLTLLTLTNNTFTHNGGEAVYLERMHGNSSTLTMSSNSGSDNMTNGIILVSMAGTLTLPAAPGLPYVVSNLTVPQNTTLTLSAGAIMKLRGSGLSVEGTLTVQGTASSPVIFTSIKDDAYGGDTNNDGSATTPAPGDWSSFLATDTGSINLQYATVQYGRITSYEGDVSITNSTIARSYHHGIDAQGGSLSLINNTITNHAKDGVYVNTTNLTTLVLTNNTFTGNGGGAAYLNLVQDHNGTLTINNNNGAGNVTNGIILFGTTGTLTLPPTPGLPYVVSNLTVPQNANLTLPAGVIMKLQGNGLSVEGALTVQGTASRRVIFTSIKDDAYGGDTNNDGSATTPAPGDWGNIRASRTGAITLHYATVQYGGSCCYNGIIESYGGSVSIANSIIAYGYEYGIYADGGTATIRNSQIYGNQGYGVYNANINTTINAENNWWGALSGPAPYGSGNGINYRTCYDSVNRVDYICQYYVDADPWLGKEALAQPGLGSSGPAATYQARAADPVNTANGNYIYNYTDLAIETRGLPLHFARAYNSLTPQMGPLGWGWTHSWHLYLTSYPDNSVLITFGDGHGEKWNWDGAGYVGAPGIYGVLVKNGDGSFTLTQKDQSRYRFAAGGRLEYVEDNNGNRTTLTYDNQGRLSQITEAAGRALTLSYTSPVSPTLISGVADVLGRNVNFTYNAQAELISVTAVTGAVTTHTYDSNHRLLTQTDANGNTFVNNRYDAKGRVDQQIDALGNLWLLAYDDVARKTITTDPLGRVTSYEYDAELRLRRETDALNQPVSYSYDTNHNRTQIIDKRGNSTRLLYDLRGNTLVMTDTLGFATRMTYDARNNLLTLTDAAGRRTTYTYDAQSNLLQQRDPLNNVTRWTYNNYGQMLTQIDARNNTTTYSYDANGYRNGVTNALGHTTTFVYDGGGRLLSETDALGRTINYTYDAANRLLTQSEALGKITTYAYDAVGNRTTITDPRNGVTTFAYDAKDQLITITDPLGKSTTYAYDSVGNQLTITDPLNRTTTYTYDALNRRAAVTNALNQQTRYSYDANGNQLTMTDAKNFVTTYTYDARNQLLTVTDANNGRVTYTYDRVGNRLRMRDALNRTTIYTYDQLNRLRTESNPLNQVIQYTYDAVGNRVGKTKADGGTITYAYDALNRLTTTTYTGGAISYGYDAVGNRTTMNDPQGTTTYGYDALDRLVQVVGSNGTLQYGYDLNGNRTSMTYPGGNTVTYLYDAANRLTGVTDWANRRTNYTYDAAGRQTQMQYPNGVRTTFVYNNADQLTSLTQRNTANTVVFSATYTLDAVGNRLTMRDFNGFTRYTYDKLHRLTRVINPNGEQVTYTYDRMGNRLTQNSTVAGLTTYTYDIADRLLTYSQGSNTTTLTWNANGNMTGKGSAVYTFDPLDRLTSVVSGTTTVNFAYDGDGVRLGKTVNGVTTSYLQDLVSPLPVVVAETINGVTNRYVYGTDLIEQVDPANGPVFYHADGLGSTRALSNLAGQRTDAYSYDVFGALRTKTGNAAQPFTFTGEQNDGELGLVFLRARYYDPQVGRFLSIDPFRGFEAESQSLNRYIYSRNNPVLWSDPSGEIANFIVGGIVGGVVGFTGYAIFTLASGDEWSWGKAAVATGGGALTGAALPLVAAGMAGGAIAPGALGTALGAKGSLALVGAEMGMAWGVNKSILNQQIDGATEIDLGKAAKEGVVEGVFGAWSGYTAGVPKAFTSKAFIDRLNRSLLKSSINKLISPNQVFAPTSSHNGSDGSWGNPPSSGK